MKLRNNGIRHLAKNDNGAKANRKRSCYQKKRDTLVNVRKKHKLANNGIKEVFIMQIKVTVTNLKNGKETECCAQMTGVGRVTKLSLSNKDFCQSPDECRILTKALKQCIEEDLQEYQKFLLKHPDTFAKERQYLWIPRYYGRAFLSGEMQTISMHSLSDSEYEEYKNKNNPIVIEIR